jgi:4-carboxymuconolactone decarboxylase
MKSHSIPKAHDDGLQVRRDVMGDGYVDATLARTAGTESEALQRLITESVGGPIWFRSGLDRRTRSLLNVASLSTLRAQDELAGHVRGALTNGARRTEITEAIINTSGYAGAPAALAAMRTAQAVFDDTPPTDQLHDKG